VRGVAGPPVPLRPAQPAPKHTASMIFWLTSVHCSAAQSAAVDPFGWLQCIVKPATNLVGRTESYAEMLADCDDDRGLVGLANRFVSCVTRIRRACCPRGYLD
jgi:hypothetical protein